MTTPPRKYHSNGASMEFALKILALMEAIAAGTHTFEQLRVIAGKNGKATSRRTARRYIAAIEQAGFPYHYDFRTNTYRFASPPFPNLLATIAKLPRAA